MNDISNKDLALKNALAFFEGDELAATTYLNKYALKARDGNYIETDPLQTIIRVMKVLADAMPEEKTVDAFYDKDGKATCKLSCPPEEWLKRVLKDEYDPFRSDRQYTWLEIFGKACNNFKGIVPGGSVLAAAGDDTRLQSLSNCFVIPSPSDSIAGIMQTNEMMAQIFKRRGGAGTDLSSLRPDSAAVNNAALKSSGAVGWANHFSNTCRDVAQNGRRGASILTLNIKHPDSEKWAKMKEDLTYCTGANVSLWITDEFMKAVEKDEDFELKFPIDSDKPIIRKTIKAKDLWNTICTSAHKMAEPGILNLDTITKTLPAHKYPGHEVISTNPCSEISMGSYEACRLISMRLLEFVVNPFTKESYFDFEKFKKYVRIIVNIGEALVIAENNKIRQIISKITEEQELAPEDKKVEYDLELNLWKQVLEKGEEGRRLGLGDHGWADMFSQLCIKYDSKEALELAEQIKQTYRDTAYDESVELAKVHGPFKIWDWEVEKDCEFFKTFPKELLNKMKKYGRRHISLLTNAPTGSLSILGQCSSGIEPTFRHLYIRRRKINANDVDSKVDFVDQSGDKWMEFSVFEKNIERYFKAIKKDLPTIKTEEDLIKVLPKYFITSDKIDWKKRIEFQATLSKYVDHSISSCLAVGENQYIYTDHGLILIDDFLKKEIPVKSFAPIDTPITSFDCLNEKSSITEVYNNGVADCLELRLSDGTSIVCTNNHKLFCLNEDYCGTWKEAGSMSNQDIIIGRVGLGCFGNPNIKFNKLLGVFNTTCSNKGSYKSPNYPTNMSKDLAFILGCLISDGGYTVNGIFLSQQGNNVLYEFQSKINKIFNLSGKSVRDPRSDNLYSYSINSRGLRDYVKYLGVNSGAKNKEVPKCIFQCADKNMVKEFIRGITLDGYINKQSHIVYILTSISYNLIRQVKELLNQFGIISNIVKTNEPVERVFPNSDKVYQTQESWGLYCNQENSKKFCLEIGFAEHRKTEESLNYILNHTKESADTSKVVPDYGLRRAIRESITSPYSKKVPTKLKSFYRQQREGMDITLENLLYLKDRGFDFPNKELLTANTFTFNKVLEIKNVGKKLTYDLHVPKNNSYTVNGIISHNTINLLAETSVETVKDLYMYAWKKGLKGVTVYRDGCRSGVLVSKKDENPKQIIRSKAPVRPDKLPCEVNFTKVRGTDYVVICGLLNGLVYEVFCGEYSNQIPKKQFSGYVERKNKGQYYLCFLDEEQLKFREININEYFNNSDYAAATRLLSMSLSHGAPIEKVIDQLKKSSTTITEFGSALSRILKKYIKIEDLKNLYTNCSSCGSPDIEIRFESGCHSIVCKSCNFVDSKCD